MWFFSRILYCFCFVFFFCLFVFVFVIGNGADVYDDVDTVWMDVTPFIHLLSLMIMTLMKNIGPIIWSCITAFHYAFVYKCEWIRLNTCEQLGKYNCNTNKQTNKQTTTTICNKSYMCIQYANTKFCHVQTQTHKYFCFFFLCFHSNFFCF